MANKEEETKLLSEVQDLLRKTAAARLNLGNVQDERKRTKTAGLLMLAEMNLHEAYDVLQSEPVKQEKTHTAFSLRPSEGELPV